VTGGGSPAAIWRGFMEAALPRLNAPRIPDGPAMPEGWQAPDPVGDLISNMGDPMEGTPVEPVDPNQGDPYLEQPAPPRAQTSPNPPIIRPTSPQPGTRNPPAPQPDARPPVERRSEPLFF
jgi:penicillin-binding protein 1A